MDEVIAGGSEVEIGNRVKLEWYMAEGGEPFDELMEVRGTVQSVVDGSALVAFDNREELLVDADCLKWLASNMREREQVG